MASLIYLYEKDLDRARAITDAAPPGEFQIELVSELKELKDYIESALPDAVFVGYKWVEGEERNLGFLKSIFSIIYADEIGYEERLLLYQQGITRILDLSDKNPPVLYELVKIYTYRQHELKPLFQKFITQGNMGDFHLNDILYNAIFDKINFSIKVRDGEWVSRLRLYKGRILEAEASGLVNEDAAIHLLLHNRGTFRLRSFSRLQEISTLSTSTYGILNEAAYEKKLLSDFLGKFKNQNPVLRKAKTIKSKMDEDQELLLQKFEVDMAFNQVLEESPFSVLKTLRIMEYLWKKRAVSEVLPEKNTRGFTAEDIRFVRDNYLKGSREEGRMLILGLFDSGISTLLQTMAEASDSDVKTTPAWQYAQLKLANDMRLFLFAISIETNFQPVVEKLSSDAMACIFLIDDSDEEKMEYSKYVMNQLFGKYKLPLVFGVTKFSGGDAGSVDKVRERYGIPPGIKVMATDPGEFDHVRKLIYNLSNSNYREIEQVD